jgi:recombinational DNA repair protein (RecF pathway)
VSRAFSVDAIVLAMYNVGEADRFCVLFTRERGRIAARAAGARRPGSHIGGNLLPFRRVTADIREWSNGYIVSGAKRHPDSAFVSALDDVLYASEIVEVLLLLVHDEEPLEEIFDCIAESLAHPASSTLPTIVRILHVLGLFPATEDPLFSGLPPEERGVIASWIAGTTRSVLSAEGMHCVQSVCDAIVVEHASRRRNVPDIATTLIMRTSPVPAAVRGCR